MDNKAIGILCGFEAEAMVARKLTQHVVCSGAVEALAFERAESLVQRGAKALVSFGVAGALAPDLGSHNIVVASHVAGKDGQTWRCETELVSRFTNAANDALSGGVYGSTVLVPTPEEKRQLHVKTSCLIVDMESHVVAQVATKHNLPFAVLRGVSDSVNDSFPDAALNGINPDGTNNMNAVYKSLLRNPLQIPALMKLFKHTGIALKQLDAVIAKL